MAKDAINIYFPGRGKFVAHATVYAFAVRRATPRRVISSRKMFREKKVVGKSSGIRSIESSLGCRYVARCATLCTLCGPTGVYEIPPTHLQVANTCMSGRPLHPHVGHVSASFFYAVWLEIEPSISKYRELILRFMNPLEAHPHRPGTEISCGLRCGDLRLTFLVHGVMKILVIQWWLPAW